MIAVKTIEDLVQKAIEGTSIFLISCEVNPGNSIQVLIDNMNDTSVEDCIKVSRGIEHNLDREQEDFELNVSSPGLTKPFLVYEQYVKNVGRKVKVKKSDGTTVEGGLIKVQEKEITLSERKKERIEGRKSKQWVDHEYIIPFEEIKETKVIISFK